MFAKRVFIVVVALLMILGLSCKEKETGIKGRLILQTGQSGDVRNSRVRLFVSSDLTGNPVKEVASDATGVDQTKSEFEFTEVVEGYYYILAWKDLNGSGVVDNNDIVGVHGGTYRPGYGGTQVTVTKGKMTDVGDIIMLIYKELILTTRYVWEPTFQQQLAFYYKFNDDCNVTSWKLKDPTGYEVTDADQNGAKVANTEYRSPANTSYWWTWTGGAPVGTYVITITGTWSGNNFTIADTFNVTH
ncbi:MAG: hypothetical protein ABIK61_02250 [candidate division WOR-3 bacterium]